MSNRVAVDRQNWLQQKRDSVYLQYPNERMSQAQVIGALNDFMAAGDTLVCAAGHGAGRLAPTV